MPIERRPIIDREQWKAWRRQDVATASTVGALFNCHPYVTALRLYVQARGVEFPDHDNAVMRRGRWLEPAVAVAVREQRPDWTIEPADAYYRDPDLKLGATPDFFVHGDPRGLGVLQAKTATAAILERDWDNGESCPTWIILQAMTEALLTEAAFAVVAVLVVDPYKMDCKMIEIAGELAMQADIVARVRQLRDDVAAGREPQPDFAKDAEVIKLLAPHEIKGTAVDLSGNNELPMLLARREELRERMKHDEAECSVVETELKYLMGEAETVAGLNGWRITYRTENRKGYTVAPSSPRVLRIYDRRD
jgi:predicted phage-related endonuclease